MEEPTGVAARVRPLPPKNFSLSAKARPLKRLPGDVDHSSRSDVQIQIESQLLPNQAFEAAVLWRAAHVAQTPIQCAEPGCTKQRVFDAVEGGAQVQRVFCRQCEVKTTSSSCARDRPLPPRDRRQTRASSRPGQCQAVDTGEEALDHAMEAESLRRQTTTTADAAHAEKEARLASSSAAGTCAESGCTRTPTFGLKSSNKAEFCRDHKKEGMVNEANKKTCGYSGCTKLASHGSRIGSKYAQFCAQHARGGMLHVISGRAKRRRRNTDTDTGTDRDLLCALTGASANGSEKRSRRVGILQRTSPVQPYTAVKKEIDESESCPSTPDARKVAQRMRERKLRRNNLTYMGGW